MWVPFKRVFSFDPAYQHQRLLPLGVFVDLPPKPRIWYVRGKWFCGVKKHRFQDGSTMCAPPVGAGHTPSASYADWLIQRRREQ